MLGVVDARALLYVVVIFAAFFQAGRHAAREGSVNEQPLQNDVTHPIPKLMAEAEDKFRSLLARQSKTLEQAVSEYKRKYRRDPPKGFDEWWSYAVKNNFRMVDEFDGMHRDLEPFYKFSAEEFRRRVGLVGHLPSIDLVRIANHTVKAMNMKNGLEDVEVSERANGFRRMVEKFNRVLPDMDFPINGKAEGRVLIPWEQALFRNLTRHRIANNEETVVREFTADWRGSGNVWEAWRLTCTPNTKARKLFHSVRADAQYALNPSNNHIIDTVPSASDFSFLPVDAAPPDFCQHPEEHYLQGHFFSDWRTIPALFPILSPARAKGYSDILIPSHYYHQATPDYSYAWDALNLGRAEHGTDPMEVPWEKKEETIFWRGSTTGGGGSPPGFIPNYQRHRLVRLANDMSTKNRTLHFLQNSTVALLNESYPVADLNSAIMDVAFVRLTAQADYPGGRAALARQHRFAKSVPLGEHWRYKYLVDVDGMGYSARFLSFLESECVPVKSTVYEEYFTPWIQPWLHYIPLSQTYQEIYNIYAFFSGRDRLQSAITKSQQVVDDLLEANPAEVEDYDGHEVNEGEGARRLRRIARAGRNWKKTIGRPVDMEAYVYRLALEWARLWSDDREAMSFRLENSTRPLL